ncbi:MAG: cyanophycinase [Dokdonia sp.]|jgi:cyanophycinase
MKKRFFLLLTILTCTMLQAQSFTSFFTGDPFDVTPTPDFGICLMGGATENDNAMIWFLEKANGGDVLVLRASGSDGYNDYFFSELGVTVNSVETILINNASGATDPYVIEQIENAEAIWFAGGDQYNYVSYFKDTPIAQLLTDHVIVKGGVLGGTSAGMAILGDHYFSAENGTVTSAQALQNPYHPRMAIGSQDFIELPFLENTITDTHFDSPDRRGRSAAFLARIATDFQVRSFGIASEEFTAVCIEENGEARVFGGYPNDNDFAYFMQANCTEDFVPENCTDGNVLNWNRDGEAIKVYKVPGTQDGANTFNLADWETGSGGDWENWWVTNGVLQTASGENPNCSSLGLEEETAITAVAYPNPFTEYIQMDTTITTDYELYTINGQRVLSGTSNGQKIIETHALASGIYFLQLKTNTSTQVLQFIKK